MLWEYYLMGIILLPGIIFAIVAQAKINSAYTTFSSIMNAKGYTGAEVARTILSAAQLSDIKVNRIGGHLTDHYNPKEKSISLSGAVHDGQSISAIGIAAHEVGHALQYKTNYWPMKMRTALVPVINFTSAFLWPLLILGLIFNFVAVPGSLLGQIFIWGGIGFFGISVLFSLITLPVEYNASKRALSVLQQSGILTTTETAGAKKVLSAAALTYVASLLISILTLLRFLAAIMLGRRR